MSRRIVPVSARSALYLTLGFASVIAAPAACLYPSYTFNEPEPSGSGGNATSSGAGQMTTTTSASSSSGAGGATTSTTSSGSTSSTSTGMGPTEDCTDGIDNDGDGKIDCADSDCTVGYSCHNPVPAGWTGHYALADGTVAALPGNCPGATYPNPFYTGYRAPNAPAPQCSACSCGVPQGETCGVAQLHVSNSTCALQTSGTVCQAAVDLVTDGVCHGVTGLAGGQTTCGPPVNMTCPGGTQACNLSVLLEPAIAAGGSCVVSPQVPTIAPFSWGNAARACQPATEGKGCANDFACLPNAPTPFGAVCISMAGDNVCPAGSGYTTKKLFFDLDPMDTRACSSCACGAPTGLSCTSSIMTFSDAACGAPIATTAAGACSTYPGNPAVGSYKSVSTKFTPGTCTPSGGVTGGAAVGLNPVTFCCQ